MKKNLKKLETKFSKEIDKLLKVKKTKNGFKVLDLFSGCGGMALGFEAVGFETIGYDNNKDCCLTYEENLDSRCFNLDLNEIDIVKKTDVVIGGPPCQPFSVGGLQKGILDSRDGFPAFLKTIKKIKPKLFVIENVRGLLYKNKWYLDKIINFLFKLNYKIDYQLVNMSEYLVPQNRQRLIIVGYKNSFEFPKKSLKKISAEDVLGNYFDYAPAQSKYLTKSMDSYIRKYEIASKCINPRDLKRNEPSRTLTCRNLAGSTSDMMRIKLKNGKRRKLFVREAARLQTFPDWFNFRGSEQSQFYQIGNSVPPMYSYQLALKVLDCLTNKNKKIIRSVRFQPSFL